MHNFIIGTLVYLKWTSCSFMAGSVDMKIINFYLILTFLQVAFASLSQFSFKKSSVNSFQPFASYPSISSAVSKIFKIKKGRYCPY